MVEQAKRIMVMTIAHLACQAPAGEVELNIFLGRIRLCHIAIFRAAFVGPAIKQRTQVLNPHGALGSILLLNWFRSTVCCWQQSYGRRT